MKDNRKVAIVSGALILFAYIVVASFFVESNFAILVIEIVGGASVVALALLLYPILKPKGKLLAKAYAFVKAVEGIVLIVAAFLLFLSLITNGTYDAIQLYHTFIFALAFLLLSVSLLKSKLVPRYISVWGIVGSILMMSSGINILIPEILPQIVTHLPVILNEIFLALWLIVKGFRN